MAPQCLTLSLLACSWQSQKVFSQLPWSERARGDSAEAGEGGEGRWKEREEEFDAAFLRIPGPSIHASLSPHGPLIKDMKRDTMAHTLAHTHMNT